MYGRTIAITLMLVVGWTGTARAQTPETRAELKRWHDRLFDAKTPVSVADGREARQQLARWNLDPQKLEPEARGQLLRLEIIAALAVGDAAHALKRATDLEHEFPTLQSTRRAVWLSAVAAGDAALARRTLDQLKEAGSTKDKAIAARLARLQIVGHPAPERTLTTADGQAVALRPRKGVVLVVDIWNTREPPADRQSDALKQLVATYHGETKVTFLGINTDASADADAARKFAVEKGYTWPQCYETSGERGSITEALRVESTPWNVIIDGDGNVRAVGLAWESEFQYALRTAIAEAKGDYPVIPPRTLDGQPAARPTADSAREASQKDEQPAPEQEPPHDPEAARLLDQARLYLKTGKKTEAKKLLQELIEKYPHTWEAREARRLGLI